VQNSRKYPLGILIVIGIGEIMSYAHRFKILLVVIAAILSLCMLSCSDQRKKDVAASRAKEQAQEAALRVAVQTFAKNSGADCSWQKSIIKKHTGRLYSIDLEAAWLINNPILFIGSLENVATADGVNYQLLISDSYRSPKLKLQLLCPKQKVDSIIKTINNDSDTFTFFEAKIAIAARVTQIKYVLQPAKEGMETVFIGHGTCTDVMYLGDALKIRLSNEGSL
jgi:outer membrane murein-binding lipoprotein Lpp/nitrogen regulatory protein PII